MILELVDIRISAGQNAAFEAAVQQGVRESIGLAKGFQGYKLNKGIENAERYVLLIYWETLEDHTVGFRQSAAFTQWRAVVGPFFAVAPVVEHFELAAQSV